MKKLIALIGAVALICSMAFPALANGSINELKAEIVSLEIVVDNLSETVKAELAKPDVQVVATNIAEPDNSWTSEVVKDLVSDFNDPNTTLSMETVVEELKTLAVNEGNSKDLETLKNADFASGFAEVSLVKDGKKSYSVNGEDVPTKQTLKYEQLKGLSAEQLIGFQIFLMNPETGKFVLITLNPENFDPLTGEITVDFPFLGTYALVQI